MEKKSLTIISLQRLNTFLAQCKKFFAPKDHSHDNADLDNDGFMSSGSYVDLQAMMDEIKALKKTKEYDGGKASDDVFEDDLNGGGAGAVYTLEQTDFTATLKADAWIQNGTGYQQVIERDNISGLNDYLIAPNMSSTEDQTAYDANFAYVSVGSSIGRMITVQAVKKPTIDLSVRFIKL